jgi:hypothetical protein
MKVLLFLTLFFVFLSCRPNADLHAVNCFLVKGGENEKKSEFIIPYRRKGFAINNLNCYADFSMKYESEKKFKLNFDRQTFFRSEDTLFLVLRSKGSSHEFVPYLFLKDTSTLEVPRGNNISDREYYFLMYQQHQNTKLLKCNIETKDRTYLISSNLVDGGQYLMDLDAELNILSLRAAKSDDIEFNQELVPEKVCPVPRKVIQKFLVYCANYSFG